MSEDRYTQPNMRPRASQISSFSHLTTLSQESLRTLSTEAIGTLGESVALGYLLECGYTVETQNWEGRTGELDLIAYHEESLVFVEVRTVRNRWLSRPAEAVTSTKQRQVSRCADEYIRAHPNLCPYQNIRFDVLGVLLLPRSTPLIDHVENAFYSPWAF